MRRPYLSVIIPCYNEEGNLKKGVLSEVEKFLKTKDFSWEVIISDDGSTDQSKKIVKEKIKKLEGFSLLENPHGGKPTSLFYGLKRARGEIVLFTDMDQSTPISELDKLLPYFKKGYSVVIGSRGMVRKKFPLYRKLGSVLFRFFRQLFVLRKIADTQCGFKAFKREPLKEVFPKLSFFRQNEEVAGWRVTSYDVELLFILFKKGYKIAEVPVSWQDRDVSSRKASGPAKYLQESKEMFFEVLRVKLNDLRGEYDL